MHFVLGFLNHNGSCAHSPGDAQLNFLGKVVDATAAAMVAQRYLLPLGGGFYLDGTKMVNHHSSECCWAWLVAATKRDAPASSNSGSSKKPKKKTIVFTHVVNLGSMTIDMDVDGANQTFTFQRPSLTPNPDVSAVERLTTLCRELVAEETPKGPNRANTKVNDMCFIMFSVLHAWVGLFSMVHALAWGATWQTHTHTLCWGRNTNTPPHTF